LTVTGGTAAIVPQAHPHLTNQSILLDGGIRPS
jgi:hypothetical protein